MANTIKQPRGGSAASHTVRVPTEIHLELKEAAYHRRESIPRVIGHAWDALKRAEGKRLYENRQPKSERRQININSVNLEAPTLP